MSRPGKAGREVKMRVLLTEGLLWFQSFDLTNCCLSGL